jgi:hypothetical protein
MRDPEDCRGITNAQAASDELMGEAVPLTTVTSPRWYPAR